MRLIVIALVLLSPATVLADPGCAFTREQWAQVKLDMPISKVNSLLDCEGVTVSESRFGGSDYRLVRYDSAWKRSVVLTYQNRRLAVKAGALD